MAVTTTSTWAPLASPIYRALWIAQFVSNLGTWMQTVGAQWMLVGDPRAPVLVPLVQTATTLPVMLLALPSGVLADLVDRRRLLLATQGAMAAGVAALATLTGAGLATPTVLLTLLFLIGCGQALTTCTVSSTTCRRTGRSSTRNCPNASTRCTPIRHRPPRYGRR
ncbi:MFS transporter [Mycolicibacterium farcinogenes]|nr:MFS transporter [Mycolicibacterium farcinogenes]